MPPNIFKMTSCPSILIFAICVPLEKITVFFFSFKSPPLHIKFEKKTLWLSWIFLGILMRGCVVKRPTIDLKYFYEIFMIFVHRKKHYKMFWKTLLSITIIILPSIYNRWYRGCIDSSICHGGIYHWCFLHSFTMCRLDILFLSFFEISDILNKILLCIYALQINEMSFWISRILESWNFLI